MSNHPTTVISSFMLKTKRIFLQLFDQRVMGAMLLIVGTALGGGILALPVSNSLVGFGVSTGYLLIAWFIMTFCAFLLLEINLQFPVGINFLTMAKKILGTPGQILTGFIYLFLLYTLLAAYIAGGSDIVNAFGKLSGFNFSQSQSSFLFVMILGLIVFSKLHYLDYVNRIFVSIKFLLYFVIVYLAFNLIDYSNITKNYLKFYPSIFMVLFASFGFAVVIPSLRQYLNDDIAKLRIAILFGSFIPLIMYILWDFVLMGALGTEQLASLTQTNEPTSQMIQKLNILLHKPYLAGIFYSFASICLITSFFGISLSLSDFLTDGLRLKKTGSQKILLFLLTFLPPWLCVIAFARGYITALTYAGVFCLLLHVILPMMMGWVLSKGSSWFKKKFIFNKGIYLLVLVFTSLIVIFDFFYILK